ncbi:hypothetical protein DKP78_12435 [Enterococcus faecium]|nr:hypothetical protein DKP78_12435 [Enterococcus faecium]
MYGISDCFSPFFLVFLLMTILIERCFIFKTSLKCQIVYFFFSVSFILVNLVNFFEVSIFARITYIVFSFSILSVYLPAVRQMKLIIKKVGNQLFKVKHRS